MRKTYVPISQRGETLALIPKEERDTWEPTQGRVLMYDTVSGQRWPDMRWQSVLARGYWEDPKDADSEYILEDES